MATEYIKINPVVECLVTFNIVCREQSPEEARLNAELWWMLHRDRFVSATSVENASCSFWPDDEKDNQVFHG